MIAWPAPRAVLGTFFLARLVFFGFVDCWVHRWMHGPRLWRVHRWHHIPTHTGWLAGSRESIVDRLLVDFPYFLLTPLIADAPSWVFPGLLFSAALRNDWMHLNVSWGWRAVEWLLVTPRFHHVHHSTEETHRSRNLAVFFSCWDHLFGTYHDPEGTEGRLTFGIEEKVSSLRLFLGV